MVPQTPIANPKRGDVYLVRFDPIVGAEISKTRPAVILQNDIANRYSPITIVAGITSKFDERLYPTEVPVSRPEGGLSLDSVVLLDQIRSVDRQRLVRRLGSLRAETIGKIDRAIEISLGLVEL